ncbi:adenosine kinase 1 [Strongylocentrotus purpuratus]|uniref:Adenosine kinase n=1 Tax=Strongylocentrotus purpuratus TaxID=7668 RepID=A0A7M7SVX8_STRPU|nr:adenosine kinase 1 [Strongylocentrotus purpuratus]
MANVDVSPGKIAGFGIPLLDFIADVDDRLLDRYGLECDSSNQATEEQKVLYDELSRHPRVQVIPGGAVPNALRIAQWLLGIPNITMSFGCIGDDAFGKILTDKSQSEGVYVQYQVHPTQPTGTCAVLITGQHRCLVSNYAAAKHLSSDFIFEDETWRHIKSASCFYLVGYFIHTYPSISRELADFARRENKVLTMNLSAVYVCEQSSQLLTQMIEHAQYVFGNKAELQAYASALDWQDTEESVMMKMSRIPSKTENPTRHVIITHSSQPTLWCNGTAVRSLEVPRIAEDKIVDTCGAGDAFVGGFLSQLVQHKTIEECIRCGHYAAGLSIQQRGMTITGSPSFR